MVINKEIGFKLTIRIKGKHIPIMEYSSDGSQTNSKRRKTIRL